MIDLDNENGHVKLVYFPQMEETMQSLKRAEETLKQKSCEVSEYESFKKR